MSSLACTENVSLMLRGSTSYSYLKIKNWHQSRVLGKNSMCNVWSLKMLIMLNIASTQTQTKGLHHLPHLLDVTH
ncbi:hypothetical protein VNO80_14699 [Phaseolus coccineus]|uniref:Uncharacterized protein n=1 Tax=Phaseolus coccineus TaxID=3886 RepID=A0AAN9R694_PHACN